MFVWSFATNVEGYGGCGVKQVVLLSTYPFCPNHTKCWRRRGLWTLWAVLRNGHAIPLSPGKGAVPATALHPSSRALDGGGVHAPTHMYGIHSHSEKKESKIPTVHSKVLPQYIRSTPSTAAPMAARLITLICALLFSPFKKIEADATDPRAVDFP